MASISDILKEISDVSELIQARLSASGAVDDGLQSVAKGMAMAIARKVASMPMFSAGNALELCAHLGSVSLSSELAAVIQSAADARL
eukprot:10676432-Alexandrium_andersonii.AAC.1